jgi:ABC-type transporter MlaC component
MRVRYTSGDTAPAFKHQLTDRGGQPLDLTTAQEVRIRVERVRDEEAVVDTSAEIVNAGAGKVRYDWEGPELSAPGR